MSEVYVYILSLRRFSEAVLSLVHETVPLTRFLAPRYWLTWLAIVAVRVLTLLPAGGRNAAGWVLGRVAYFVLPARRRVARINIGLCLPELDSRAQKDLLRRHFHSLGLGVFEAAFAWWASDRRVDRIVSYEGQKHLDAALAEGRGVILLTGHFTPMDLNGRFASRVAPIAAMYRRHKNLLLEEVMRRGRIRQAEVVITSQDARAMLRHLRKNLAIVYAPDQVYRQSNKVVAPFFGLPAASTGAISRFARLSGAAVLPVFTVRLPGALRYRVDILPPLKGFPSADLVADVSRYNALLEERIRLCPEQYLWVHKRFKRPTPEHRDPYKDP